MDLETLHHEFSSAATEVLQEAAYVFVSPVEIQVHERPNAEERVRIRIPFISDRRKGGFEASATRDLCLKLNAEMLGAEDLEGMEGFQPSEVIGEVLNMVAGLTLSRILEEGETWELGVPETVLEGSFSNTCGDVGVELLLETEEGDCIELSLGVSE